MGIMTKSSAELATQRADDAKQYALDISSNSDLALKKSREEANAALNTAKIKSKANRVDTKAGGAKFAAKMKKDLLNDEIKGQDRINLLTSRKAQLESSIKKTKGDTTIAYQAELLSIKEEVLARLLFSTITIKSVSLSR